MRANSRHTSRNKKVRRIIFIAGILILSLVALPWLLSFFASLIFAPVYSLQTWMREGTGAIPSFVRDRTQLVQEIEGLKEELLSLSGERYTLELLSKENEVLRHLNGQDDDKRIVAGIIGRPNKVPYDVLVIDKGSEDGIVVNAPVFVAEKTVIGSVRKVFGKTSIVELVTSPSFTSSVYIFGPDIYTNAEGMGGGQMRVGVPQGIELQEGDLVVLPSADSGVYGKISVVDSVPTRPEQYGYVSPEIPLSSLRFVSVGNTPLNPISFEEAQAVVAEARNTLFEVPVPEDILVTTGTSTATSTATSTEDSASTTPEL